MKTTPKFIHGAAASLLCASVISIGCGPDGEVPATPPTSAEIFAPADGTEFFARADLPVESTPGEEYKDTARGHRSRATVAHGVEYQWNDKGRHVDDQHDEDRP